MFNSLAKAIKALRTDYFLLAPFMGLNLCFLILDSSLISDKTPALILLTFSYSQSVVHSLVMLYVLASFLKIELSKKFNKGLRLALLINLPFLFFLALLTYMPSESLSFIATGLFIIASIAMLVMLAPFSASIYICFIQLLLYEKSLYDLTVSVFKSCYKKYALSFRLFIGLAVINSFVFFVTALQNSDFLLADIILAFFLAIFSTLSLLFAYYFYIDNFKASEIDINVE